MERRSQSLQSRLNNVKRRLREMRTVTNTASAEISGGETVIDADGSIYFLDGGRLVLGSSTVSTLAGTPLINGTGDLSVDSLTVYGDVLSAADYMYQRETIDYTVVDTDTIESMSTEVDLEFPDWSSTALVTFYVYIDTRVRTPNTNNVLVKINGKTVARPRSDSIGNVQLSSTVVRRVLPDNPTVKVDVELTDDTFPTGKPRLKIALGGVYSA